MTSCIRCGATMGEFDAGGDMVCQNCEAAGSAGAGGTPDVPCQRCGMYLPPHELRMWNSRLYCAYCIMDIQDEEKRARGADARGAGGEGGRGNGICERCGRETDTLYSVQGRRLCSSCYSVGSQGGAGAGGAPLLSLIVEKVALALGVRQKPRIIPAPPQGKVGIRAEGNAPDDRERQRKSLERFNLKERRMMEEEEGQLGVEEPLSEGHRQEKKPSPEARKKFFSRLGGEKK
jgi:hypothetical protein